jgi:hypothetical protein
MSEWIEIKKDAIDLDFKSEEVELFVTTDDFGSIYAILKFEQIK